MRTDIRHREAPMADRYSRKFSVDPMPAFHQVLPFRKNEDPEYCSRSMRSAVPRQTVVKGCSCHSCKGTSRRSGS